MPRRQYLTIFIFVLISTLVKAQVPERDTLELFYAECDGDNWFDNTSWLRNDVDICDWFGVRCDSDEVVIKLELPSNNVLCRVPPELFELEELQVLDLQGNTELNLVFTDIQTEVKNLQGLYVEDTAISSLKGMDVALSTNALLEFSAGGSALTGQFPTEVLAFTNLLHLDLSHNFLSGNLPVELPEKLSNIITLSLSHNMFDGGIPTEIGTLSEMHILHLQDNWLSGPLPMELENLSQISTLFLCNQVMDDMTGGLTGPLPDFANLSNLLILTLCNNRFTGEIPATFLNSVPSIVSHLQIVDLKQNLLTGDIPTNLARFQNIRLFVMENEIDEVDPSLCAQTGWFHGDVGIFGCDAIVCPPGTFNQYGRQTLDTMPCLACDSGTEALFYGSTSCSPIDTTASTKPPGPTIGEARRGDDPETHVATKEWIMFLQGVSNEVPSKDATTTMDTSNGSHVYSSGRFSILLGSVIWILVAVC